MMLSTIDVYQLNIIQIVYDRKRLASVAVQVRDILE